MEKLSDLMKSEVLVEWFKNEGPSCGVSMQYRKNEKCVEFLVTKNREE